MPSSLPSQKPQSNPYIFPLFCPPNMSCWFYPQNTFPICPLLFISTTCLIQATFISHLEHYQQSSSWTPYFCSCPLQPIIHREAIIISKIQIWLYYTLLKPWLFYSLLLDKGQTSELYPMTLKNWPPVYLYSFISCTLGSKHFMLNEPVELVVAQHFQFHTPVPFFALFSA